MKPSKLILLSVISKLIEGSRDLFNGQYSTLPSLREQAALKNAWTKSRIDSIPALLQKHGVDAWLMSQREYAEDTVFWSLKSFQQFSARRRTLQLFFSSDNASTVDNRGLGNAYTWIDNTPSLWKELRTVLERHAPRKIAVNVDAELAFSSGLHAGEFDLIKKELGGKWAERFVSIPLLAIEFVGTMPGEQLEWYKKLMGSAWAMISEAFSERVIKAGKTSTEDVEWWLRSKIQEQNYTTWFQPDVTIVHPNPRASPESVTTSEIINCGDMLHVDFGITALGMNTDTQHLAYVLHPGQTEDDIPSGLLAGMKKVNSLQDIAKKNMKVGMTGNEILNMALAEMKDEGIEGAIYSHAIGDWGHSAGTVIGMTNLQSFVPHLGELPLLSHTYYSVELYAEHFVPEYNATMNFYQEEDVFWNSVEHGEDSWEWVWARQEKFHLIKTSSLGMRLGEKSANRDSLRVQSP